MTIKPTPLIERLMASVMPEPNSGCWLFTGHLDRDGYGHMGIPGAFNEGRPTNTVAHRISYEALVGPIPDGLQLDHKCRVRCCVNPDHLEPVTPLENLMRSPTLQAINAAKTHCDSGHPLDGDNLYRMPNGNRSCRTCRREASRKHNEKRRAARRAARAAA